MNKFKIVSLALSIALLACLVRLVYVMKQTSSDQPESKATVVMQNILSRKSVRAYTDQPVSRAQIDTLLRAAMAAPTGRDMRPWKFIVVDDKEMLKTLAGRLPYAKMLPEAQAAVLICGDLSVTDDKGNPSTNWMFDCSAATENLLLAAESMGLGAVWTAVYPYDERLRPVTEVIQLPDYIVPLNVIPIGYPKGNPQPKDKYDTDNIHYNGW